MPKKPIPRWQQGFRPATYGEVWDKMTPAERRGMFLFDMALVGAVSLLVWIFAPQSLGGFLIAVSVLLAILFAGNQDPAP